MGTVKNKKAGKSQLGYGLTCSVRFSLPTLYYIIFFELFHHLVAYQWVEPESEYYSYIA